MDCGIHVQLSVDGIETCPVTALSREVSVESIVSGGRDAGDGTVGEATVTDPPDSTSVPDGVDTVFADGSRSVYRFEADGDCPCTRLPAHGCPIRDMHAEAGTLHVSFIVPCVETVRTIVADLRSRCETVRVRRLARSAPDDGRTLVLVDRSAFTDRQYEVLRTAHEMGYFEQPKEATSADVAAALGISVSTFSEHLATTQSKLLDQLLTSRPSDDSSR